MPMIIDPAAPNPVPPTFVTSPDGILVAKASDFGVQLRAQFDTANMVRRINLAPNPSFSWTSGLTSGGSAVLSVDSSWSVKGGSSIKITPDGTSSTSAAYAVSSANPASMQPGHTYMVSATIKVNAVQTGTLDSRARRISVGYIDDHGVANYALATSAAAANVAGTVIRLSVLVTMPADMQQPLVRLMNGSSVASQTVNWDALLIEETTELRTYFDGDTADSGDYGYSWTGDAGHSASIADPTFAMQKIRFVRNGEPVRSGNDAWAVGGVANAFDGEMPAATPLSYQAFPVDDHGNLGVGSQPVTLLWSSIDIHHDCWLRSVDNPAVAGRFEMQGDPEFSQDGTDTLTKPQGSPFWAGGIDTAAFASPQYVFKTYTLDDFRLLQRILDSGVVLWQGGGIAGLDDFYGVRENASWAFFRGSAWPERLTTVTFKIVARPDPFGAPLIVPGHSFDDTKAAAPTLNDRLALFPQIEDTLGDMTP